MRTPISYYGGKQRMKHLLLPLIPSHKIYVEPYFGGGTLFFEKGPSFLEVINDINDNVINFYRVLKSNFDPLYNRIQESLLSETLHRKAYVMYHDQLMYTPVDRAWAFWMVTNFSHSNKIGGGIKFDMGSDGSHSGRLMSNKKSDFHYYKGRLADVHISCRDALRVIRDRDEPDAFFYLDPPYPGSDQGHYKGFTWEDLHLLLILLKRIRGKFMMSNYLSDLITRYARENAWEIRTFDLRLSAPRIDGRRKNEIVVMNYSPNKNLFQ